MSLIIVDSNTFSSLVSASGLTTDQWAESMGTAAGVLIAVGLDLAVVLGGISCA